MTPRPPQPRQLLATMVILVGFIGVYGLLVWQLMGMNPVTYCSSVFNAAAKAGETESGAQYYVTCVIKLLDTKTIAIVGCLGIIAVLVIAFVIMVTKVAASFHAPGGFGGSFGTAENPMKTEIVNESANPVPVEEK